MLNNYNKRSVYFFYFFKILSIKSSFFIKFINGSRSINNSILLRFFWKIKKFTFKKSIKTFIKVSRSFCKNIQNSKPSDLLTSKIFRFRRRVSRKKWILNKRKERLSRRSNIYSRLDNSILYGKRRVSLSRRKVSLFKSRVGFSRRGFFKKNLSIIDYNNHLFAGYKVINRRFKNVKLILRGARVVYQIGTYFKKISTKCVSTRKPNILLDIQRRFINRSCTFTTIYNKLRRVRFVKKLYIRRRLYRRRNFKNFYLRKKYIIRDLVRSVFSRKKILNKTYFFNLNRRRISKSLSSLCSTFSNLHSMKKKLRRSNKVGWGRYNWKKRKFIWRSRRFKFRFFKKKRYFKFFLKNKKHFICSDNYNKLNRCLLLNILNRSTYNWGIIV